MSFISPYMKPAKIVSYDKIERTAQVTIAGLTDGLNEGITALLAYPIGDDDQDTERELIAGADVWVFFEEGDTTMPVVAFYRRHGKGRAVVDVRRIRQENIELLARANMTLKANDIMSIEAKEIHIKAKVSIDGDITHAGNQVTTGNQTVNGLMTATTDVIAGGISVKQHTHGGVRSGGSTTSPPI